MTIDNPSSRPDEPIRLVPHDPAWAARFRDEAEALASLIRPWITGGIHHVGSTSVPGLDAKPIIDIAVGVASLDACRPCIDLLAELDYRYAPYRADVMHWFCKPDPARRTHHLHLIPSSSERFTDELAFRNYLRAHPSQAMDYAALKHRLAAEHRDDREAYTQAKAGFVALVTARARAWAASCGDG